MTVILDIDGTLVDSNYQHAIAWARAFGAHEIGVELWRVHRHIGMGGDQLVAALCDDEVEARHGDSIRSAESELYGELIDEVQPLPGAIDLIAKLKENGRTVVLASSAKEPEVEHYVDLLEARELADGWTTATDVERTKPAPNLILAALECAGADPAEAVMVGDSTWDCKAAQRAGVEVIGLLCGGFGEAELLSAGATAVLEGPADLGATGVLRR